LSRIAILIAVLLALPLACAASFATAANGVAYSIQGSCASLDLNPGAIEIDQNVATIACPGASSTPIDLSYSDGYSLGCIFIDNVRPDDPRAFFVPLKTHAEWKAFLDATINGSLKGEVQVTYGCPAATVSDTCTSNVKLPAARHGTTASVKVGTGKTVTYTCIAIAGCGTWTVSTQSGSCVTNGVCGSATMAAATLTAPTNYLCSTGMPTTPAADGDNWRWTCDGAEGGTNADCQSLLKRNAACGAANDANLATKPTADLCADGDASAVNGTGPWTWTCTGSNGGTNAACAAQKKINGACGSANGTYLAATPTSNLCSAGTATSVAGNGPWTWTCTGSNGGTNAACAAPRFCTGVVVGGYCWYAGVSRQSCDQVCADKGSCNIEGTRDYAGAGGNIDNCFRVATALGSPYASPTAPWKLSHDNFPNALGCYAARPNFSIGEIYRGVQATSCAAASSKVARACACGPKQP